MIGDDADGRQLVADNKVAYKQLAGGVDFVDAIPKNPNRNLLHCELLDRAREMKAKAKLYGCF